MSNLTEGTEKTTSCTHLLEAAEQVPVQKSWRIERVHVLNSRTAPHCLLDFAACPRPDEVAVLKLQLCHHPPAQRPAMAQNNEHEDVIRKCTTTHETSEGNYATVSWIQETPRCKMDRGAVCTGRGCKSAQKGLCSPV